MLHHYDHERIAQAHRQELLREAERERQLGQLPRPRRGVSHMPRLPLHIKLSWQALRVRLRQGF